MRSPLRQKARAYQAQISASMSYPAPVGGWNARDALADMSPSDAITLENWFCKTGYLESRGGYDEHATGMTGDGQTLAVYNALNGTNKMFAFTTSGVYDVSSAGAVGASVAARTSGKHQWVNFGDGTNSYLIAVNGVDKPLYYNGTSWIAVDNASSPALTGLTSTSIIGVFVSKGRIYFIEKNSLSVWYLAAGAAGGALTEFDLSSIAKKGGYLMAGATWTVDGGDGPDDRIALVTSEGEAIIYAGTNPGSAASWALVGVYEIGNPLGRKCLTKFGGDLIVLTQNGAFPLSAALQSAAIDYKLALSFKIENAFTEAAQIYGANYGWIATVFPKQAALLVNVPLSEGGAHEQYVMNTITKAWSKFKGWGAEDFVVYDKDLYFLQGSKVYQAWTGSSDNGSDIVLYGKTAFSYFGRPGLQKHFRMFRPVIAVNGNIDFLTDIDVDFKNGTINGTASYSVTSGGQWGVSMWGSGYWGAGLEIVKHWTSPAEYPGFCASGKLKIATNALTIQWMACDYVFEYGGVVG